MPPDFSELSSITASLEVLAKRVSHMAEAADSDGDESVAAELFGVERALDGARRRLARMVRRTG
jgi:hypothetical protein